MANSVTGLSTWFTDTINTDLSHADLATLANGRVVVAFGGGTSGSAQLHTALVSTAMTALGALNTSFYPAAPGQLSVLRSSLEIDARAGGGFTTTFGVNNSAIGPDTTFGGLIQRHGNTGATNGPARLIDTGALANHVADNLASVALSDGRSMVFSTSGTTLGGVDAGLRLDILKADGKLAGPTRTVVDSENIGLRFLPNLTSNPEINGAVQMANGNLAIVYKAGVKIVHPTTPLFDTVEVQILLQEVDKTTGARLGDPIRIVGPTAPISEITKLADGRLLVIWQDSTTDGLAIKGQLVSADGDTLVGAAFDVSAQRTAFETLGDVVALNNGGFAISWTNAYSHHMARMFKADGTAAGNDFLLTDNGATFAHVGDGEITAKGNSLVAMTIGIQRDEGLQKMFGQVWSTANTMGRVAEGTGGGNRMDGTAKDDRLSGKGGADNLNGFAGNDILLGGDGKDKLSGGAGRDVLMGGAGIDTLTGGAGSDVFMFAAKTEGPDRITDFSRAEGDRITLDNFGFGTDYISTILPLTHVFITNDATADEAGFHFNTTTRLLSYDVDGAAGAQTRVNIAYLTGVSTIEYGDLMVY